MKKRWLKKFDDEGDEENGAAFVVEESNVSIWEQNDADAGIL